VFLYNDTIIGKYLQVSVERKMKANQEILEIDINRYKSHS